MKNVAYKRGVLENAQIVNYVQQGEGPPVIPIHGLAASLRDWDDLLPVLAEAGYAGYALDLLGHGESHKPANVHEYSFDSVYDHYARWIDSLELREPLILIGHSLGGGISLAYAIKNPQRVRALVLVNPFYDVHQLPPVLRFVFRRQMINTALMDRTPYRLFRFMVDMTSFNFYIGQRETHVLPEHIRYQTALDYKRAASGIYNIPRTLPDMTSDLRHVQQPTLLVWGERDQTLATKSFPHTADYLPNVVGKHAIPFCGHVPHQCHPEKVNPLVIDFLATLN